MESIIETLKHKDTLTPDLGGKGTTSSVGDMICEYLKKQ
jgi:isocitrate/isopropylmalate dehydrogenase